MIGDRGERAVVWWLRLRRWQILARNLRIARYELDIVAVHPAFDVLAIVEVKSSRSITQGLDRVRHQQQGRIASAASNLPWSWRAHRRLRFDVALVHIRSLWCQVTYCPGAFDDPRG